jgi:hypothetical protein
MKISESKNPCFWLFGTLQRIAISNERTMVGSIEGYLMRSMSMY